MAEEINCRRSLSHGVRRPVIATARQRLAQRALRQMDDLVSNGSSSGNNSNGGTTGHVASSGNGAADGVPTIQVPPTPRSCDFEYRPSSQLLESSVELIKKHGFNVDDYEGFHTSLIDDSVISSDSTFKEPDELRSLCIVVAESDQKFYVNKDYLGAWSEQFRQFPPLSSVVSPVSDRSVYQPGQQTTVFHFPGNEAQLQLLLNVVWPIAKRFCIDQIVEVVKLCSQWVTHESLTDVAAYYLHSSIYVTPVEKLKLAALCGNALLLYGALQHRCDREAIFRIVNHRPDDYSQIRKGPFASVTVSKMLEHAAGEGDLEYRDALAGHLERELAAFKRRLAEQMDFSQPDDWRHSELVVEGASFFVNRYYLAAWSPVLRQAFFGDFRERRQNRLRLDDDVGSAAGFRLFLSLLHPTVQAAALKMLPREYSQNFRCNQWIDDLFACIFGQSVDTLLEVFKLAHRYQVSHLVDACLVFVETKSGLSLADKLLMADAYHLPRLMALCVTAMTSHRVVKHLVADNGHLLPNLSCQAHRILLERLLSLI